MSEAASKFQVIDGGSQSEVSPNHPAAAFAESIMSRECTQLEHAGDENTVYRLDVGQTLSDVCARGPHPFGDNPSITINDHRVCMDCARDEFDDAIFDALMDHSDSDWARNFNAFLDEEENQVVHLSKIAR